MIKLSVILDWLAKQLDRIKTVAIILLIVLFTVATINNGCQREQAIDLVERVTGLNVQNDILSNRNENLQAKRDSLNLLTDSLVNRIEIITQKRDSLTDIVSGLKWERDTLKDWIRQTPTSELYAWLDEVRFPYTGEKIYKFNQPQVNEITYVVKDYDLVKQENKALAENIEKCSFQLTLKDSVLNKRVESFTYLREVTQNQNEIIGNMEEVQQLTDKQVKQLKRKITFWKIGTGVAIVAGVLLAL